MCSLPLPSYAILCLITSHVDLCRTMPSNVDLCRTMPSNADLCHQRYEDPSLPTCKKPFYAIFCLPLLFYAAIRRPNFRQICVLRVWSVVAFRQVPQILHFWGVLTRTDKEAHESGGGVGCSFKQTVAATTTSSTTSSTTSPVTSSPTKNEGEHFTPTPKTEPTSHTGAPQTKPEMSQQLLICNSGPVRPDQSLPIAVEAVAEPARTTAEDKHRFHNVAVLRKQLLQSKQFAAPAEAKQDNVKVEAFFKWASAVARFINRMLPLLNLLCFISRPNVGVSTAALLQIMTCAAN